MVFKMTLCTVFLGTLKHAESINQSMHSIAPINLHQSISISGVSDCAN